MTNSLKTQCIHCQTRFRLLQSQLDAAGGMVRCGSCRQVFNAAENLYAEAPYDEEAWAAQLLAEEFAAADTDTQDSLDSGSDTATRQPAIGTLSPLPQDSPPAFLLATPDEEENEPSQANQHGERLLQDELIELDDEPLELDWQPKRMRLSAWLWAMLSLLAIVFLAAQYVYFNFEQLARQDSSRAWLQRICPTLGCTLPNIVNVELMKSSNLMVRQHPDFNNALLIDAVIYNRAPYTQTYPLIQLNFADASNQTLASRTFSPNEYLGGELAGSQHMPSQTPIRIAFEVLQPTQMAENYSLEFLSPE